MNPAAEAPSPAWQPLQRTTRARHITQGGGVACIGSDRLDAAIATAVELQAELVLGGVQVAALYGTGDPLNSGAVLPGGSPYWLAADLDLMVRLVRLAAAAGIVLPHGMAGTSGGENTGPDEHLRRTRTCYRDMIDLLGRMSVTDEVPPTCQDEALRLLRQVERRVQHLGDERPATDIEHTLGRLGLG